MNAARPPAYTGWVAIGAVVLAAEAVCRDTLTECYRSAHPVTRAVALAGWVVLVLHLHGLMPSRFDPLHYIVPAVRWRP